MFNRIIEECTNAKGNPTMGLYRKLMMHISDKRLNRFLFSHDFRRIQKKEKKGQKEGEPKDTMELGFQLDDMAIDGNQSVFGFLMKQEAPVKGDQVGSIIWF
jgi:hypothetical protein